MSTNLTPEETENYKLLLCMAAGGLAPRGRQLLGKKKRAAFEAVLACLDRLQPRGTIWKGRPEFLTDALLKELQEECAAKKKVAKPTDRYLLSRGGPIATRLARHSGLARLVANHYPDAAPTGIASYIFYDEPGHGLDPHVDTEVYAVNVILMLKHQYRHEPPSHLLLYESTATPRQILLKPGELIIINAGSVVHAREDMKEAESVSLLTLGYQYPGS